MATTSRERSSLTVLHGIPYKVYGRMTRLDSNRHLRMTYYDGTLEIVSPLLLLHESPSTRIVRIVLAVAERFEVPYHETSTYTFRKGGDGPFKGKGKEPDESFYLGSLDRVPRDRDPDLDAGDPPPDLWIEVDNRVSSAGRLPVYVALGVPEVWRYRARSKKLQFLALAGLAYEPIQASRSLPMLTPALVFEALKLGDGLFDSEWSSRLREWVDRRFPRPGPAR